MSGIATSAGRNPAIVTGIVGMMLGLALGIGFAGVVLSIDARGVATSDGGGVALTQAQVAEALRAHVAREYSGDGRVLGDNGRAAATARRAGVRRSIARDSSRAAAPAPRARVWDSLRWPIGRDGSPAAVRAHVVESAAP